jgi:hypothetical protein
MIEDSIDVEIHNTEDIEYIGQWLDATMPNSPLPEIQRWSVGYDSTRSRIGIKFSSQKDATLFLLKWG